MIGLVDIVQKSTTLGDHHQQAATAADIFLVDLEMLSQREDFLCQNSSLHVCRTSVLVVSTMGFDCLRFCFHTTSLANASKNYKQRSVDLWETL